MANNYDVPVAAIVGICSTITVVISIYYAAFFNCIIYAGELCK